MRKPRGKVDWIFIALFLLAVLIRTYGAYVYQFSRNLDYHTVVLMARHMAAGIELPVFFYGQAYMGSFEPMISALLYRYVQESMFAICMGTAVFGILITPLLFHWAKDLGGRIAGYVAMTVLLIGPQGYFHYLASPRGGYSLTLLFGAFILWYANRLIGREREGESPWLAEYFMLGVVAGLGLWSNFLIIGSIGTAAIMFLLVLGGRVVHRHLVTGVMGTLLGSAPLWLWNLQNQWQSLAMGSDVGKAGFLKGMNYFWGKRMWGALGTLGQPPVIEALQVVIYGGAILIVLWMALSRRPAVTESDPGLQKAGLWMLLLFLPVNAVIYSLSSFSNFNTPRYHLPLLPVLAVLTGVAAAWLWKKRGVFRYVAVAAPAYIAIAQFPLLPTMFSEYLEDRETWTFGDDLKEELDLMSVDALYANRVYRWVGAAMDEAYCVSKIEEEPYYRKRIEAELSDSIAVLNNYGFYVDFVNTSGGTLQRVPVGKQAVYFGSRPPRDPGRVVSYDHVKSMIDNLGVDRLSTLSDSSVATRWTHDEVEDVHTLTITTDEEREILGVRAIHVDEFLPERMSIRARTPNGKWWDVLVRHNVSDHFWSGPRSYYGGIHRRFEARFRPGPYSAIQIQFQSERAREYWSFAEVQLLEKGGHTETGQDLLDLYEELRGLGTRRVYADRWVANGIHQLSGGDIWTSREPDIYRESGIERTIRLDKATAFVVKKDDSAMTAQALASRGVEPTVQDVSAYRVFYFTDASWKPAYADLEVLAWLGVGASSRHMKLWSMDLLARARQARENSPEVADELLAAALDAYPNNRDAVLQLARWTQGDGAGEALRSAQAMWTPEVTAFIEYENEIRFLGYDEPEPVQGGDTAQLNLYWAVPEDLQNQQYAVFVHLTRDDEMVADDHVLLQRYDLSPQLDGEVFVETVGIAIPPHLAPGDYTIKTGVYNRAPGHRRLKARTRLPEKRGSVTLPAELTVR